MSKKVNDDGANATKTNEQTAVTQPVPETEQATAAPAHEAPTDDPEGERREDENELDE